MNLAERLSEYALSIEYRDLSSDVVLEAKKRVIDTVGCAIGAFREGPIEAAKRTVRENCSGDSATILGAKWQTTPDMAAFVNGAMARYFDFNDTYLSKEPAHPSDNIAPCLAVAEKEGSSGKELLAAIVVAYEVQCRLCDAADLRHRGWDHVCYGLVSAALAAGRLMRLTRNQLTQAVNISLNSHIAMRQVRAGELSDWKGFSFANAARNAVFSASLARRGITGPSPIFEGEMGFFAQVSGPFELDVERFGGRRGTFKLAETYIKYFPAEYHAQSAIWAALAARRKVKKPEDIVAIEVDTHEAGYNILGKDPEKWFPMTRETADHSLPFLVGSALLKGGIETGTFSSRSLRDQRTLQFLKRISVKEDPELTRAYPRDIANRIRISLKGGSVVTERTNVPKGHPRNPMTKSEIESKFKRLTKRHMSQAKAQKVIELLWDLDGLSAVDPLFELCAAD